MASPFYAASKLLGPDSREDVILEVRAGKMAMQGTTVKPDLRKGTFVLLKGEGFLRFLWKERDLDSPEDDILVFPGEANFDKVQQSIDRVYILKFKHDDRKYFFWMQEPNELGDEAICHLVNCYLDHSTESDEDEDEDEQVVTFDASASNLQDTSASKVHVGSDPLMATTEGAAMHGATTSQTAVQLEDLQRILSSISPSDIGTGGVVLPRDTGPSLADILKPELVVPLLENCHLEDRLVPFLPEGTWTLESIAELLQSPQFHQQVDAFTHVLRTGQIDLTQFGIDSSKYNFTVTSFLEAIEDQVSAGFDGTTGQDDKSADESPSSKGDPMEECK